MDNKKRLIRGMPVLTRREVTLLNIRNAQKNLKDWSKSDSRDPEVLYRIASDVLHHYVAAQSLDIEVVREAQESAELYVGCFHECVDAGLCGCAGQCR